MTGEITKDMFKKLLNIVEQIEKDNDNKRSQLNLLEQKLDFMNNQSKEITSAINSRKVSSKLLEGNNSLNQRIQKLSSPAP